MSMNNEHKIIDIFGLVPQDGDVGIEIECEAKDGPHFPTSGLPPLWGATNDGSLRGISIEYVLQKPIKVGKVDAYVKALENKIKEEGTELKYSFRAGVHVHINCQDLTPQQVAIFAALYYSLENVLVEWCGDDRIGNHFCLRVCDAEGVLPFVGRVLSKGYYGDLEDNAIRYASLNFCALPKYGSLEFRAMATEPSFDKIAKWASILHHLKLKSKEFDSIQTILEHFSMSTPQEWLEETLGDFYSEVKDQQNINMKVWDGIHSAQDLLFYTIK